MFELRDGPDDKIGGLVVRARNKYTFLSTAGLLLTWRVLLDGVPLMVGDPAQGDAEGWFPGGSVPLAPQVPLQLVPSPAVPLPASILFEKQSLQVLCSSKRMGKPVWGSCWGLLLSPCASVSRSLRSCGCPSTGRS